MISFFRNSNNLSDLSIKKKGLNEKISKNEITLIKYISDVNQKKQAEYDILKNLVFGSLVHAILNSEEYYKFLDLGDKKTEKYNLGDCKIYFDTNYVFSLLGLDYPNFNTSAEELYELLTEFGCKGYVFSFTVDEMCRVLKGYQQVCRESPTKILPGTLYSALKAKGWKQTDASLFIASIGQKLKDKGIIVHQVQQFPL